MSGEVVRTLDADDDAVYSEAFVLAEAVRLFLARNRTQEVIATGFILDRDVTDNLIRAHERMEAARRTRLDNAWREADQ